MGPANPSWCLTALVPPGRHPRPAVACWGSSLDRLLASWERFKISSGHSHWSKQKYKRKITLPDDPTPTIKLPFGGVWPQKNAPTKRRIQYDAMPLVVGPISVRSGCIVDRSLCGPSALHNSNAPLGLVGPLALVCPEDSNRVWK